MIGRAVRATFDGIDSSSILSPRLQSLSGMSVGFEDGGRRRNLVPRVDGELGNSSEVFQLDTARRRRRPEDDCVRCGSGRERTGRPQEIRKGSCPVDGHHGKAKKGHGHPNDDPSPPGLQPRHRRHRGSLATLVYDGDNSAAVAVADTTLCWSGGMQVGEQRRVDGEE